MVTTHDGSRTLRKGRSEVTWRSTSGAVTESRQVYLLNSGILGWPKSTGLRLLEIGFGTGLNFLLTADALTSHPAAGLTYFGIDQTLISSATFAELAYRPMLQNPGVHDRLAEVLEASGQIDAPGLLERKFGNGIWLQLRLGDVRSMVIPVRQFHAIFHDPFGPDENPDLWQADFLEKLYRSLMPGGRLTSYCVKSSIQRQLRAIGFQVQVHPGPVGGKREVLIAIRDH